MKNFKVLVVDDQYWIKEMLKEVLSDSGFSVFAASGHTEAIETTKREWPDIVVLDINLPEINGFDLLSKLKKVKTDIKVVFISGFQNIDYVDRAVKKGALGFFTKPFDIYEFRDHLVEIRTAEIASGGKSEWELTRDLVLENR